MRNVLCFSFLYFCMIQPCIYSNIYINIYTYAHFYMYFTYIFIHYNF